MLRYLGMGNSYESVRCSKCTELLEPLTRTGKQTCKCGNMKITYLHPIYRNRYVSYEKQFSLLCPFCAKTIDVPPERIERHIECPCGYYSVDIGPVRFTLPMLSDIGQHKGYKIFSKKHLEKYRLIRIKYEYNYNSDSKRIVWHFARSATQDDRMENAVVAVRNAILFGEPILNKKGNIDDFTIRNYNNYRTTITYNLTQRTISCYENRYGITLQWLGNGFKVVKYEDSYYGNNRDCSMFNIFLGTIVQLWGELWEPQPVKDFLTNSNVSLWGDITIHSLNDIHRVDGQFHCLEYGPHDINCYSRTVDHLIARYQKEHGYANDPIIRAEGTNLANIFYNTKNDNRNYYRFENYIKHPKNIPQYKSRPYRQNKRHHNNQHTLYRWTNPQPTITAGEHEFQPIIQEEDQSSRPPPPSQDYLELLKIKESGKDKCIFCGGHIHNIEAYKGIPTDLIINDKEKRFGALCCGCFRQIMTPKE